MTQSRRPLEWVREREFSGLGEAAYLNAASLGPLPMRSLAATQEFAERRKHVQSMKDADFAGPPARARELIARLIGARAQDIALAPNTSFGINLVAMGLDLPDGATVLVSDGEFPANVYPWMNRDRLRLEIVPLTDQGWPDEGRMLERLGDPDVAVLSISSVQFHNGYHADLETLGAACRAKNVVFVVDAIQSVGHMPMDVDAIHADVVACGGHKWLCGPFGSGFAYVRPELQERLRPPAIGWYSMRATHELESVVSYEWDFVPGAARYEVGTQPLQDQLGLAEALDLLLEAGIPTVWSHIDSLLQPLRDWLRDHRDIRLVSSSDPVRRSGIVSFRPPGPEAVLQALKRAGVICSLREGSIRIAAHFYNNDQDIDLLLEVLDARAAEGWG